MHINRRPSGRCFLALCSTLLLAQFSAPLLAQSPSGYELAIVDMRGKKQVLGKLPASVFAPRVSPDGEKVAFELVDPAAADQAATRKLWVADLEQLDKRRALPAVGTTTNMAPVWTDDGERLVFQVAGNGSDVPDALYWRRADGKGDAEKLIDGRAAEDVYASDKLLSFITLTGDRDYGISSLDIATKVATPLVDKPNSEQHSANVSPDGKWVVYTSTETGTHQLWLEPLPQTGQRYRLTDKGGQHPLWSPDGAVVFFDQGGQMYKMFVFLDKAKPQTSEPEALPIKGFQQGDLRRQYDLMPEGFQFLMLFPLKP
jgi:Tol biopolymer transport system component